MDSGFRLLKLRNHSWLGNPLRIIATHSPILLACPGAVIYSFDDGAVKAIDYRNTDHYLVYKGFMENLGRYIR